MGVAGLELWPSGDWSSQTALPAIHSHRERARVSSALVKTCMETRVTPTGYRRLLSLQLSYLIPQTGLMGRRSCPLLDLIRSFKAAL